MVLFLLARVLLDFSRSGQKNLPQSSPEYYIIQVKKGGLASTKQKLVSLLDHELKFRASFVRTEANGNVRIALKDSTLVKVIEKAFRSTGLLIVHVPPLAGATVPQTRILGSTLNREDPDSVLNYIKMQDSKSIPTKGPPVSEAFEARDHQLKAWLRRLQVMRGSKGGATVLTSNGAALETLKPLRLPAALRASGPTFASGWECVGPSSISVDQFNQFNGFGPVSARITTVAMADRHTMYIGAATGGVWKKQDNVVDKKWHFLSRSWGNLSLGSVMCDPSHPNVLFVGTGDYNQGYLAQGDGIEMSIDGGVNWTHSSDSLDLPLGHAPISKLLLDPGDSTHNQPEVLIALSGLGPDPNSQQWIYRCENPATAAGFQNWTTSSSSFYGAFSDGDIGIPNPTTHARTIYVVGHRDIFDPVIFYSNDHGATWQESNFQLPKYPDDKVARLAVVASKSVPGVAYIVDPNARQVFATADGGENWTATVSDFPGDIGSNTAWQFTSYNCYLACAPTSEGKDRLLLGLVDLLTTTVDSSTVAGSIFAKKPVNMSWTSIGGPTFSQNGGASTHNDQHSAGIFFDGQRAPSIVVSNDGGVFILDPDAGTPEKQWTSLNEPELMLTNAYWAYSPAKGQILTSTLDNGAVRSSDGRWNFVLSGDSGICGGDGPVEFALEYLDSDTHKVDANYTRNGWSSLFSTACPIDSSESQPFFPAAAYSDADQTLYIGTNLLHFCNLTDDAYPASGTSQVHWQVDRKAPVISPLVSISSICPVQGLSGAVFIGLTDGTLWSKNPSTGTWAQVNGGSNSLPAQGIVCQCSLRGNSEDLIVGVGGQGVQHLWRCQNMSSPQRTWTAVSISKDSQSDVIVNCLARDPRSPSTVWYAATDGGVFMTDDAGQNWQNISQPTAGIGLPPLAVTCVQVNKDGELLATTFGMGVFTIPVPKLN